MERGQHSFLSPLDATQEKLRGEFGGRESGRSTHPVAGPAY